ncbi:helix-turn-helix domain-containing protein [Roseiconus nitratireducens]|uniref:Helix-turn-helix domain-containing protein n=1 Tax=Roseiconus nitratireducens TaxID=2605748 RepID=A0A5M6D320_9BACT|nr:ester cyclase [Roseiconus nitratireducens]KAA5539565.1 helix-turn-helix domain-containing protein [Roseiconus nitratireducens]
MDMKASDSSRGLPVDGKALKNRRMRLGLTQEAAAKLAGYSDRVIRKLERGGPVLMETLDNVVEAYNGKDPVVALPASAYLFVQPDTDLEAFCRRWFDGVYNQRDLAIIDEMMAEDVQIDSEGEVRHGRDTIRNRVSHVLSAFNPLTITVESIITQGNTFAVNWSVRKKHVGEFLGLAATGRWIEVKGTSQATVQNGQIVSVRDHWDIDNCLRQISGDSSRPV